MRALRGPASRKSVLFLVDNGYGAKTNWGDHFAGALTGIGDEL